MNQFCVVTDKKSYVLFCGNDFYKAEFTDVAGIRIFDFISDIISIV
jgi:hypothetical protein